MVEATEHYSMLCYRPQAPNRPQGNVMLHALDGTVTHPAIPSFVDPRQTATAPAHAPLYNQPMMQQEPFDSGAAAGMVFLNDRTEPLKKICNSGPVRCWDHGCDGRQFSSLGNYRRHLKERNQACKRFYCPRCERSFSRSTARNDHFEKTKCKLVYFDNQGFPITVPFVDLGTEPAATVAPADIAPPTQLASRSSSLSYPQPQPIEQHEILPPSATGPATAPLLQQPGMTTYSSGPQQMVHNGGQAGEWEIWLDDLMAA